MPRMTKKTFQTLQDLAACVGQEVAVSDWITITQEQVNQFAEATGDHQWIHVDVERAMAGPFGGPIAHGFLTLSLLPRFFEAALDVDMDPLVVARGLCELVHLLLRDGDPVAHGNFLADAGRKILKRLECLFGHARHSGAKAGGLAVGLATAAVLSLPASRRSAATAPGRAAPGPARCRTA